MRKFIVQWIRQSKVSKRERSLVALAALAVVIYSLINWLVLPIWDSVTDSPATIEAQTRRVVNYRRVLLGTDSVKAALDAAQKQTKQMEGGLLSNRNDSLASAELQGLLREMAISKGMNLRRSDPIPVKVASPEYEKVSARIEVMGNIDQLVGLLAAMETSPRILFLEEIRISPATFGNPKIKPVNATLTVSAVKVRDGSVPATAPKPPSKS